MKNLQKKYHFDPAIMDEKVDKIMNVLNQYYTPSLKSDYKDNFGYEYAMLKRLFPTIDFQYEGRIKNYFSLKEKVYKKLAHRKSGNIYDIFAKKIVVYSVNGNKEEEALIEACYQIEQFLRTYNAQILPLPEKCKDYIESPKNNGYQAIHLIRQHNPISEESSPYCSEIQIRTFRMEEQQKFGTASHMLSYKPNEIMKKELCPTFLEIGKTGKTYELSEEQSFEKYYRDYDVLQENFSQMILNK